MRITKALRGLVSYGRCFQIHLRSILRAVGLDPSLHEHNLWVYEDESGSIICISAFVDELVISGKQPWKCLEFFCSIKTETNLIRYLRIDLAQQNIIIEISGKRFLKESIVRS